MAWDSGMIPLDPNHVILFLSSDALNVLLRSK